MNYKHQVAGIVFTAVIHSISMCRMRRFLAILRSFFHLLSPHLAIHFLIYLSVMLFPNTYTIPLWEFYFLPISVHAVTIHNSQHKLRQSPPVLIHHCSFAWPNPTYCCLPLHTLSKVPHTHTHTHTHLGSSTIPSLPRHILAHINMVSWW